jgi:arylsulfatase
MIANVDANIGRLLDQLDREDLAANTVVIFMTDNGHSVPGLYNTGMRAAKGTVYQGGVRVPSFWRWPGHWAPGDRPQPAAHLDIFPTLAELAGATVPATVRARLEGRSLVPALENARVAWADRTLVSHVGRWKTGQAAGAKFANCAIRNARFKLVNNAELYDLQHDPAEARNVLAEHPAVVTDLRAAYDRWWAEVLPDLENELARGPAVNPFKARYWEQFGGAPTEELRRQMDPEKKFAPER